MKFPSALLCLVMQHINTSSRFLPLPGLLLASEAWSTEQHCAIYSPIHPIISHLVLRSPSQIHPQTTEVVGCALGVQGSIVSLTLIGPMICWAVALENELSVKEISKESAPPLKMHQTSFCGIAFNPSQGLRGRTEMDS